MRKKPQKVLIFNENNKKIIERDKNGKKN